VRDGLLKDLHATISQANEIDPVYKIAPLKTPGAATE
jgi:hypothetical protein